MESTNLKEIDDELKKLYKRRDKAIEAEFRNLVGKCFHPPGIDIFAYVISIKGRDVKIIELALGDIIYSTRHYEDQLFSSQYEASKEQFKTRLKDIHKEQLRSIE